MNYVWDLYKKAGYVTGFVEDLVKIGLFNYFKEGFKIAPTDFYPRPYWLQMYAEGWNLYQAMGNESHFCFEDHGPKIDFFLEHMEQFIKKMNRIKQPYFMYSFYSQVTHENFNYFKLVDDPVADFINRIGDELEDTIFIFMGDHGSRFGSATDTPMGRLEERMPLFSIRIPEKLNQKHPHLRKYLNLNENRLLAWFDVNQLLKDVALGKIIMLLKLMTNF